MTRKAAWALGLVFALLLSRAAAESLEGHVIHVADGDTITILDSKHQQLRVRIGGIDAPERRQAFFKRSTVHLSSMVRRQIVTVQWYKKDRYGRLVGTVYVKGVDVGLEQVLAGYAWWYRRYANEQSREDRERYDKAELVARKVKAGLWADPNPMPPWEWRRSRNSVRK